MQIVESAMQFESSLRSTERVGRGFKEGGERLPVALVAVVTMSVSRAMALDDDAMAAMRANMEVVFMLTA